MPKKELTRCHLLIFCKFHFVFPASRISEQDLTRFEDEASISSMLFVICVNFLHYFPFWNGNYVDVWFEWSSYYSSSQIWTNEENREALIIKVNWIESVFRLGNRKKVEYNITWFCGNQFSYNNSVFWILEFPNRIYKLFRFNKLLVLQSACNGLTEMKFN